MTSEQLPVIAQNLDTNNSDSVRLRAMQQLLAVPASDPQAAEHWVDIRAYLNNALKDPNSKISVILYFILFQLLFIYPNIKGSLLETSFTHSGIVSFQSLA